MLRNFCIRGSIERIAVGKKEHVAALDHFGNIWVWKPKEKEWHKLGYKGLENYRPLIRSISIDSNGTILVHTYLGIHKYQKPDPQTKKPGRWVRK